MVKYMERFFINESKYSLESRFRQASASSVTKQLVEQFNYGIEQLAKELNMNLFARTHVLGLTYFATQRKSFMYLNIYQDFLTLKFYTGGSNIDGLQKGNYNAREDNCGSEPFRITDDATLRKSLVFARQSLRITADLYNE